jgi:hypothetical protein
MADGTLQILGLGTSAVPLDYTASGDQSLDLVAVNADYDGGAAGVDWQPVVEIISTAGHVMARGVGPTITAGDSASVTFAPFLKAPAAGGNGVTEITSGDGSITVVDPFGPVTDLSASIQKVQSSDGSVTVTDPFGPFVDLSVAPPAPDEEILSIGGTIANPATFSKLSGSNLVSLVTPTVPSMVAAGTYSFALEADTSSPIDVNSLFQFNLQLRTSTGPSVTVSVNIIRLTGGVTVSPNSSSATVTFTAGDTLDITFVYTGSVLTPSPTGQLVITKLAA